jgi:hypothetical protein
MRQNAGLLTQHVSGIIMPTGWSLVGRDFVGVWGGVMDQTSLLIFFQVWTPESGTHYCTPEDGYTNARNMLSQ